MQNTCRPDPLYSELKHLVAARFRRDLAEPDKIPDEAPLIGGGLGLDSLDALELALLVEEKYHLSLQGHDEMQQAFTSIERLAGLIRAHALPKDDWRPSPAGGLAPVREG